MSQQLSQNSSTQVLIARHGNTFLPEETPRRVGGRTDLPLVENKKAENLGLYLRHQFAPHHVYSSPLLRTQQTASIALAAGGFESIPIQLDDRFIEIDYGPDENRTEDKVLERIGQSALDQWNTLGLVPDGWQVDIQAIKNAWLTFFSMVEQHHQGQNILVVTSNGIARFAPTVLKTPSPNINTLKMKTGYISLFYANTTATDSLPKTQQPEWQCGFWNKNPIDLC